VRQAIDQYVLDRLDAWERDGVDADVAVELPADEYLALFDAQAQSRHLDFAARWMQSEGFGFYTIGSAGHESNAAVAMALRPTDPALLHYRSGGFYAARAKQVPGTTPIRDVLLGMTAGAEDPASGGRHKVFGNHRLAIIPQTSTIGSHLPRAFGLAFALARPIEDAPLAWPADAVVVASFGDASANHSTVTGAINAAAYCAHRELSLPLLLVCEDNGIGISVRTPTGWIEAALSSCSGVPYFSADGADPTDALTTARRAADAVREQRRPAILHLKTVRFMGHAGSDAEIGYRGQAEIVRDYARDPLLGTARLLVAGGLLSAAEVRERYERVRAEVMAEAGRMRHEPRLSSAAEVMRPLTETRAGAVRAAATLAPPAERRMLRGGAPEQQGSLTLAQSINAALGDVLATWPQATVFGEDVGRKGGVYGVTRGLAKRFGPARVFDTLLDEQTILGTALGAALSGRLPIPEIQYLAYLHNAEDQLRGEAATLRFFSDRAYANGMVVRIAGLAYQKGFGGHFHNENSVALLRDIPGIVVAVAAHPADAPSLLRTCAALAQEEGRVCVFLETIALYHTRDLHTEGDELWTAPYAPPETWDSAPAGIGDIVTHREGDDLLIVTFGNGVFMSLRAARALEARGIDCTVADLRWLQPLPIDDLLSHAGRFSHVLVVDETRRTGGVSEGVVTALIDHGYDGAIRRVASHDSFVPLGPAAYEVLLGEDDIVTAAGEMLSVEVPQRSSSTHGPLAR
jgi:2-oxoisovalerate dehydrogenase E1 component